jgi:hypothetical protein
MHLLREVIGQIQEHSLYLYLKLCKETRSSPRNGSTMIKLEMTTVFVEFVRAGKNIDFASLM